MSEPPNDLRAGGSSLTWVRVFDGDGDCAVVAAALDSLGLSPKVCSANDHFEVLVSSDQAPEALRFLGRSPASSWGAPSGEPSSWMATYHD